MTNKNKTKKTFFSIKAKIALLCNCSIIIAVAVNFIFMFNVSKDAISTSTEVTMQSLATSYNSNISETVQQLSRSANFLMSSDVITKYVSSEGTENADSVKELVDMFLTSNTSHEDISIVDENGIVLYSSNESLVGKDLSDQAYYKNMVSSGLSTQGDVFTSDSSGEPCITFAIPLREMQAMGMQSTGNITAQTGTDTTADTTNNSTTDNSTAQTTVNPGAMNGPGDAETAVTEFTGAIITSVKVSAFSSILSDIKVGSYDSGYAVILDASGNVIYHPDESLIGTKLNITEINNLIKQVDNGNSTESGILNYNYKNIRQYAAYSVNTDNQWILLVGAKQSEVLSALNVVASKTIMISVILVIILAIITYLFTGTITKSIKRITKLINKTSELDFTEDKSFALLSLKKDETGEMSRAIEKMRDVLKSMIIQISDISGKLTESSQKLDVISLAVNDHASDNSATAEELSASMQETASTTEQIYSSIEQIGINSNDITNNVSLGAKLSTDLISRADELKTSTTNATEKTKRIYEEVKLKTDAAIEQSKAVEKISLLSNTIKEIANQTSLLALNASIEAARAGEAGSGFSVVASEIGKLANQSTRTVSHINEVVEEVYQAVENMSMSLQQTLRFLGNNVLTDYANFLNSSENYNTDACTMNETMESIQLQIDMLNRNVQGISESIAEINTMVNESSKGVNDVAESNTNIVSLTSKTQNMVQENKENADDLKGIVEKFRLE